MAILPEIKVRPKIEAGQRWFTVGKGVARVLATDGQKFGYPVIAELDNGLVFNLTDLGFAPLREEGGSPFDLDYLAPAKIKREAALYRHNGGRLFMAETDGPFNPEWVRASELVTINFTLLPGEGE